MAGRYYETAASTGSHADLKSEMVALKHTIADHSEQRNRLPEAMTLLLNLIGALQAFLLKAKRPRRSHLFCYLQALLLESNIFHCIAVASSGHF